MRRSPRVPFIVAIVLLVLPVLYVGSYLVLAVTGEIRFYNIGSVGYEGPKYRLGAENLAPIYRPLELVDWKLRPKAWENQTLRALRKLQSEYDRGAVHGTGAGMDRR